MRLEVVVLPVSDPDGNGWMLQEITTRLPGRWRPRRSVDVATLAELLHETADHHDSFEKAPRPTRLVGLVRPVPRRPPGGSTPEEATRAADRYMEDVHHVVRA